MWLVRDFEYFVSLLIAAVVDCFCLELAKIHPEHPEDIFYGFFPSIQLFERKAIYQSCAILGATVMPHSLYLGSGIVQPRLKDYDESHGLIDAKEEVYRPSVSAIKYCMRFTIAELVISLCTVAVFVNSAILIVAGATMYQTEEAFDADLYSIYSMLGSLLGKAAGTIFALALLFSGQSAGVVCTLAGQMVSEGFVHWTVKPWLRRMITRLLAIAPCLGISFFVGRQGLATALNASQVVLSMLLPFVSAPLIYFTISKKIMSVPLKPSEYPNQHMHNTDLPRAGPSSPVSVEGRSSEEGHNIARVEPLDLDNYNDDPHAEEQDSTPMLNDAEIPDNLETHLLLNDEVTSSDASYFRLNSEGKLYKDMSSSKTMRVLSVIIFVLVSALNLFLLISMALGIEDAHV